MSSECNENALIAAFFDFEDSTGRSEVEFTTKSRIAPVRMVRRFLLFFFRFLR